MIPFFKMTLRVKTKCIFTCAQ